MKEGFAFLAVGLILGFLLHGAICKPPDPEVIVETEYITQEVPVEVIVEHVVAKLETVYVKVPTLIAGEDVLVAEGEERVIAIGDTSFIGYGDLSTIYWFPPENYFDFTFQPYPQKTQIIKILPPKPRWFERNEFYFGAGAVSTALIMFLVK